VPCTIGNFSDICVQRVSHTRHAGVHANKQE
jgi:hypothetical protein